MLKAQVILLMIGAIVFIIAIIGDKLWHPLQKDGITKDMFGNYLTNIKIENRIDFVGIDIHGGYFDFYEYEVEQIELENFIQSTSYKNSPHFNDSIFKPRLNRPLSLKVKWKPTPIDSVELNSDLIFLKYGNFMNHKASMEFIESNIINQEGSYYAYCTGGNIGVYLYVLDPKSNKLFAIRNNI